MVDVYVTLIIKKIPDHTFKEVPIEHRTKVREKLKEKGYDTNGDPILS